jgi:hypothetical protein
VPEQRAGVRRARHDAHLGEAAQVLEFFHGESSSARLSAIREAECQSRARGS